MASFRMSAAVPCTGAAEPLGELGLALAVGLDDPAAAQQGVGLEVPLLATYVSVDADEDLRVALVRIELHARVGRQPLQHEHAFRDPRGS
jgi:hypothetical protein